MEKFIFPSLHNGLFFCNSACKPFHVQAQFGFDRVYCACVRSLHDSPDNFRGDFQKIPHRPDSAFEHSLYYELYHEFFIQPNVCELLDLQTDLQPHVIVLHDPARLIRKFRNTRGTLQLHNNFFNRRAELVYLNQKKPRTIHGERKQFLK